MLEHTFRCPLARGLHARPASHLRAVAKAFSSNISIRNVRNSRVANAHSVFSLVGADIREGDELRLNVSGDDQDAAIEALRRHIENELPHCDDQTESVMAESHEVVLPHSLKSANPTYLEGVAAVGGMARGRLSVARGSRLPDHLDVQRAGDPLAENAKVDRACSRLAASLESQIQSQSDAVAGQILYVHQCMLNDEEFMAAIAGGILTRGYSAAQAILDARNRFVRAFASCENVVINEKALDVDDLCVQLLREIYGPSILPTETVTLTCPSILAVDSLTPSAFLAIDKTLVKGLVLGAVGATSHTVILARARGIPTLVGTGVAQVERYAGHEVVLDGTLGLLVVDVSASTDHYYRLERIKHERRQKRLHGLCHAEARTRDGVGLEIGANIACADDARIAFEAGADGVGLFRTEMLYMDRDTAPEEEEQLGIYADVLATAQGRPVILRTLDVGGDKPVPCVPTSDSQSGGRGIQFYVEHESLFRTQLRAMLRAAVAGRARIMIPMIGTLEDIRWVKGVVDSVKSELAKEGVAHDASVALGAMIETPAAADVVDRLCGELDFFSIGTNDLTQYHLSIDRARILSPTSACQPSLIRLLAQIVRQALQGGKWISVCGEMAADVNLLPLWVGLGVNEISVTPPAVAALKAAVGSICAEEARRLVRELGPSADAEQAWSRLQAFRKTQQQLPMIDPELILVHADVDSKEQAIKTLVDHLYIVGRTDDPVAVENALWQRESTYSTGLEHGFAVPHCDNEALLANTISVIKLAKPVDWGSLDGEPISVLIFLGRRCDDSKAHLRVFATLSRCLMRQEFRQTLLEEDDPARIAEFLREHLGERIRT